MAAQTQSPQLVILSQESPEQEAIYKNGQNKQLHSVIKNVPFTIQLGFVGNHNSSAINFHKCTLEATLMYDSLEDKPVHYVSRRPVEYNCTVDPTGDKVSVECVLNVLSSQHEGAHFRLRFAAASLALTALSDPIRVVSKPLQLKKVKEQRKAAAAAAAADKQATTATSKKRPLAAVVESATIQDTLSRIEAQQQAQQNLIANLYQTVMAQLNLPVSSPFPSSTPATPSTPSSGAGVFAQPTPPAKRRRIEESSAATSTGVDTPQATFEAHLRGLVDSFHAIAPSSRTQAVRSAVRSSPAAHVEQLSGLVGALCAEGLGGRSVAVTTRHHHHHQQPWSSVGSSPLFSAGADASDCDDYDYSNVESFLSTETSPSCSSPMSPGGGGGQSSAVGGTGAGERFSFNTIEDLFFDGASSSLSSAAKSRAVGEELSDEELYNELFASSGGSLPDAWLDLEPSQGRAGQVESSLGVRGGRGLEYVVDKTREKPHRTTTTTATTRTTSKAPPDRLGQPPVSDATTHTFSFRPPPLSSDSGQQRRRRRLQRPTRQACGRDFGFFLFVSLTSLSLSLFPITAG